DKPKRRGQSRLGALQACGPIYSLLSSYSHNSQVQKPAAVCIVEAKTEKLDTNAEANAEALQILENKDNDVTHLVVGVTRGARLTVSRRSDLQKSAISTVQDTSTDLGPLTADMSRCFKPEANKDSKDKTKVDPDQKRIALSNKYVVKGQGDALLKEYKPASYEARQGAERLSVEPVPYQEISFKVLALIVEISEQVDRKRKAFADFVASITANEQHVTKGQLDKLTSDKSVSAFDESFRAEVGEALAKARSGGPKGMSKLPAVLSNYVVEGKKDPTKINNQSKPWASKIAVLTEAAKTGKAGMPVATLAALTAGPKHTINGASGVNGASMSALSKGDVYAFYISAAATSDKGFEKNKAKAYKLANKDNTRVVIVDLYTDADAATFKGLALRVQLRRDGTGIVPDVAADEEELKKMCLVRCKPTSSPPSSSGNTVVLENHLPVVMACPSMPFSDLLQATGAGKSTFINAFVNYLLCDTLEEALNAKQLTFAIPSSFSVPRSTKSGEESVTQFYVIYAININRKLLRLVYTPGLGDTRGVDQDHKNVANIMRILESLSTISSILVL
ncbi:hypothetical protein QQS21_012820, partial [Conoideocrella luteorostrata]